MIHHEQTMRQELQEEEKVLTARKTDMSVFQDNCSQTRLTAFQRKISLQEKSQAVQLRQRQEEIEIKLQELKDTQQEVCECVCMYVCMCVCVCVCVCVFACVCVPTVGHHVPR